MGKKGDLLRQTKKQAARYTFTGEELEKHDMAVRAAYREDLRGRMKDEARKAAKIYEDEVEQRITDHWDRIASEFYTPDEQQNLLQYLLCLSSRVLIEKFHWKPVPKDGNYDRRNKTVQFAEAVVAELERIGSDEKMDIRAYNEETFKLYGIKYAQEDAS